MPCARRARGSATTDASLSRERPAAGATPWPACPTPRWPRASMSSPPTGGHAAWCWALRPAWPWPPDMSTRLARHVLPTTPLREAALAVVGRVILKVLVIALIAMVVVATRYLLFEYG